MIWGFSEYNFFFVVKDYTMVKVSYTKVSTLKKKKKMNIPYVQQNWKVRLTLYYQFFDVLQTFPQL